MKIGMAALVGALTFALSACATPTDTGIAEPGQASVTQSTVIYEDIARFWEAHDAIRAEPDRAEQQRLINRLYIDRGTPGLHAMIRARSYRSQEFVNAINTAPQYFDAVRPHTLQVAKYAPLIERRLANIRRIYPEAQPVPVYFVIGALRAGGTAIDGKLLIGAELAMTDSSIPSDELMADFPHLADYFASSPIDNLVALNLHEWVHTQQRSEGGVDLLSQALFEGVAEFVSTEGIGEPSQQPAITFGMGHHDAVIEAFASDIGQKDFSNWIWDSGENAFGQRDLGYYVGYAIAKGYVTSGRDADPIATLIELDYSDLDAVDAVVDSSGVFPREMAAYRAKMSAN